MPSLLIPSESLAEGELEPLAIGSICYNLTTGLPNILGSDKKEKTFLNWWSTSNTKKYKTERNLNQDVHKVDTMQLL